MPMLCAVIDCSSTFDREKPVRFFRFPAVRTRQRQIEPANIERRARWIAALNRNNFPESKIKYARICSEHFITGQPSDNPKHPDYVPSQKLGYRTQGLGQQIERFNRAQRRSRSRAESKNPVVLEGKDELAVEVEEEPIFEKTNRNDQSTQTVFIFHEMESELRSLRERLHEMYRVVNNFSFNENSIIDNDKKTVFLTGIPTYSSLKLIYSLIEPFIISHLKAIEDKFQHFLLTLMRLRLNISFSLLSYIFNSSESTTSRIFFSTINILYYRLKCFIAWPSREELIDTMPLCFKEHFGNKVTVVIDCFEIFIEKPSNLDAQATTWSNYKHHNTIKYLIGIAPYGAISFISPGYGGRISDKLLTEHSNILVNLLPGDFVLADHGFLIEDMVGLYCATVKTPAFLKGKKQLEPKQLEETRHIASVRVHVERIIGTLWQKYTILHETLPLVLVKRKDSDGIPVLDKIVSVFGLPIDFTCI